MSNEGLENEHVDVERAMEVLESSDEAIELEDAESGLMEKWGTDQRFQELLDDARGDQGEAYNKGALWAMAAAGGAFASLYGLPDTLMPYFEGGLDQFQFAEWAATFNERLLGVIAAVKSWQSFKEGLNMKPGINRIIERWDAAEA